MRIDIFTIFPAIFESPLRESLLGRAAAGGILDIRIHDIRDRLDDPHRQVDDYPYGRGQAGMVPLARSRSSRPSSHCASRPGRRVILLDPAGRTPGLMPLARELALGFRTWPLPAAATRGSTSAPAPPLADREVTGIGDYVLTGGELPALVLIDVVARLVPGVIARAASHEW